MGETKSYPLHENAEFIAARPSSDLSHEVSTKDKFFREPSRRSERQEHYELDDGFGCDIRERRITAGAKEIRQDSRERDYDCHKSDSKS
jgi:hypothetical protein